MNNGVNNIHFSFQWNEITPYIYLRIKFLSHIILHLIISYAYTNIRCQVQEILISLGMAAYQLCFMVLVALLALVAIIMLVVNGGFNANTECPHNNHSLGEYDVHVSLL
jgi:spore coat polysaccharide biosynthesis predicted glycosyltransferase SpsG